MISYLTHDCIDKTLWDECVAHAPNGNVYAWSWYLDLVHPGWEALVELRDDKYLSIMPLTKKKKFGISYLCQPFFAQQLGVFSIEPVTENFTKRFLRAIPSKYRLVEIRLNEGNPIEENCRGLEFHRNHLLDLHNDYDILFSHYHENTKRNLKKSLKYNLTIEKGIPIANVIQLFRTHRGASVTHWGDAEYERLTRLADNAIILNNAFVCGVKNADGGSIICGALFMKSHNRITFLFSGNNDEGKECQAMTYLIDQVIRENAGRDLVFDFEGSDDVNLARFYQGFGSESVSYPGVAYRFRNPFR